MQIMRKSKYRKQVIVLENNLRNLRIASNLKDNKNLMTMSEMAKRLDIGFSIYRRIELNELFPTGYIRRRISSILRVNVDQIWKIVFKESSNSSEHLESSLNCLEEIELSK